MIVQSRIFTQRYTQRLFIKNVDSFNWFTNDAPTDLAGPRRVVYRLEKLLWNGREYAQNQELTLNNFNDYEFVFCNSGGDCAPAAVLAANNYRNIVASVPASALA